jgi:deoxyribodipyrimidine photo-lyase
LPSAVNIFWLRRDLRLFDNTGLYHALKSDLPVVPLFIFDKNILDKLENKKDRRLVFIHLQLEKINDELKKIGSGLITIHNDPLSAWEKIVEEYKIQNVFTNHDYEPYAIERDNTIRKFLETKNIAFHTFKDQVIFERNEIKKDDGNPYTVFTPYKNKWFKTIKDSDLNSYDTKKYFDNFFKTKITSLLSLQEIGFEKLNIDFPSSKIDESLLKQYNINRDIPSIDGTSGMSIHLRFGTISIRQLIKTARKISEKYVDELIWREFYMYILWHFPHVAENSFKPVYDRLRWINNEDDFKKWCDGKTGYPIVDAGMRQLNKTGFMHNRLRMICSMFLTKYLLIDWRWGEAYFTEKLSDFELSSNNGGWQWSAGTGVDAAPYFRIFNMDEQTKRFDPDFIYIKKWIPELNTTEYPEKMIDYNFARKRCLEFYKAVVKTDD